MPQARAAIIVGLILFFAVRARADLQPGVPGSPIERTVGQRLCHGGRFRFDRAVQEGSIFEGHFIEIVPSFQGHPNARELGNVRVVVRNNTSFHPPGTEIRNIPFRRVPARGFP